MGTKINILSELTSILTKKEKTDTGVLVFSRQFKIGQLLKPFSSVKKQGKSMLSVLVAMILSRLGGMSGLCDAANRQFRDGRNGG